jgi:hypothetical protein
MHLGELATLKVKVQHLETKNSALKSSYTSTSITSMDLNKAIGQRPSNKSGLGYKKSSKTSNCSKSKEKQGQGSNAKIVKPTNAKFFNKNTIMHFNISNLIKRLTKGKIIFKATMLYFSILIGQTNCILKDPIDGFMSLKIKIIFKPKLKDMSINGFLSKT